MSPCLPPPCRGQATTLKRNGSDFSATILGSLFRSSYITIWTDVDGVYSADPRKVRRRGLRVLTAWVPSKLASHSSLLYTEACL